MTVPGGVVGNGRTVFTHFLDLIPGCKGSLVLIVRVSVDKDSKGPAAFFQERISFAVYRFISVIKRNGYCFIRKSGAVFEQAYQFRQRHYLKFLLCQVIHMLLK